MVEPTVTNRGLRLGTRMRGSAVIDLQLHRRGVPCNWTDGSQPLFEPAVIQVHDLGASGNAVAFGQVHSRPLSRRLHLEWIIRETGPRSSRSGPTD